VRERTLARRDLDENPLTQLRRWYAEAEATGMPFPETAAFATATPDGRPSVRMLLVKEISERGLVFFTGYESRKGRELAANPHAALCFYWQPLGRQVRVEGCVSSVLPDESDSYFESRPLGARLSAAATPQGEVVSGRDVLEARVSAMRERHLHGGPPRPSHWGGYLLVPEEYEFWQHQEDRLHDRFRYHRSGDAWVVERLAP
jgi:pyridoxamine 5'-phosphate oxidase